MTTMAEKIQIAADMIHDEIQKAGTVISPADALSLARRLHDIWHERVAVCTLPPGEIAKRFRERYSE